MIRYYLLILQADGTEHMFIMTTESLFCEEGGASWISRYPEDIAMVVEVLT